MAKYHAEVLTVKFKSVIIFFFIKVHYPIDLPIVFYIFIKSNPWRLKSTATRCTELVFLCPPLFISLDIGEAWCLTGEKSNEVSSTLLIEKSYIIRKVHLILFPGVHVAISQHWLGAEHLTIHYLNQRWSASPWAPSLWWINFSLSMDK